MLINFLIVVKYISAVICLVKRPSDMKKGQINALNELNMLLSELSRRLIVSEMLSDFFGSFTKKF